LTETEYQRFEVYAISASKQEYFAIILRGIQNRLRNVNRHYFFSAGSLSSVSNSEFRCFAALIVTEHQDSMPLADMSSMFALMAEKKVSSAPFRPINTMAAATLAMTASPWNCAPLQTLAASILEANCSMSNLAACS
jgi:hypothetical protein